MSGSGISARRGQRCPRSSSKRVERLARRAFRSSSIVSPKCALAPHPRRHEQRQYSTAQREEVPVRRVDGARAADPDLAAQRALDEDIQRSMDAPRRIDAARYASVGDTGALDPDLVGAYHDNGDALLERVRA